MEFLAELVTTAVLRSCPPEWLPLVALGCAILFAISEYLGNTERFKANGIIHGLKLLTLAIIARIKDKNDPPPPTDNLTLTTKGAA